MKSVGYTADRLGARIFLPVLPGAGQEMPTIRTKQFGSIDYDDADIFEFPAGLPGFEAEQRFLCIERPALRPVAFLQSVSNPELCFITLPARSVDPGYEVSIASEELQVLGVAEPQIESVTIPRQSRGPSFVSRSKRLVGVAGAAPWFSTTSKVAHQ